MKTKRFLDIAERDARMMYPYRPTWHELKDILDHVSGFNVSMAQLNLMADRLERRLRK